MTDEPNSTEVPEAGDQVIEGEQPVQQRDQAQSAPAMEASVSLDDKTAHNGPTPQCDKPKKGISKGAKRGIIIGSACVVAVILAIAAFLMVNVLDDNAVKEQSIDSFEESSEIRDMTVESKWGDQKGFVVKTATADSLQRDYFASPSNAMVETTFVADNGHYEALSQYTLDCRKENGTWQVIEAKLNKRYVYPITSIPDETLIDHLPEILEDVYALSAYPEAPRNMNLTPYYGEGTQVEVVKNEFGGDSDIVELHLSNQYEGHTIEAMLDLEFSWSDLSEEGDDWELSYAVANNDAYCMIGAIPHSGMSFYDDQATLDEIDALAYESNAYWVYYLKEISNYPGSKYFAIAFDNVPSNDVELQYTLSLSDTGQILYESPRISPNMSIDDFLMGADLAAGEYPATITVKTYHNGTLVDENTKVDVKVIVNEALPF